MEPAWSLDSIWKNEHLGIVQLNQRGELVAVSDKWLSLYHYEAHDITTLNIGDILSDRRQERESRSLLDEIFQHKRRSYRLTRKFRKKNGGYFWGNVYVCAATDKAENVLGATAVVVDISREKELEFRLRYLSSVDPLCQIFNRRHFFKLSEQAMLDARRDEAPLSLLYIDIDDFKKINDLYGHPYGDEILVNFVRCVKDILRVPDIFARIGGEEFAVTLSNASAPEAARIAQRILDHIAEMNAMHRPDELPYSVSIGIATMRESDRGLDDLIRRADQALYCAKQAGKNRFHTDLAGC